MVSKQTWPTAAFLGIVVLGFSAWRAIGSVYNAAEAIELLQALSRAGLYLASAIATASATVLALMLTMIGMIRRIDKDIDEETYRNVALIAKLATASLLASVVVLLTFVLPVGEFEGMPDAWFANLYNTLFAGCVLITELMVATVVMMYLTLRRVIAIVTPGEDV